MKKGNSKQDQLDELHRRQFGEATIKTAAHTAINIALMGATGPIGFFAGFFASVAFDAIYDNREAIGKWIGDAASSISDKAGEIFEKAGDAVGGFFKGLGSAFG